MKLKELLQRQSELTVPYHVWTAFGPCAKEIRIGGGDACLTDQADYKSMEDLQKAITWYVEQLGGKVKWEK